jgi:Family of unknown function (DUF6194)
MRRYIEAEFAGIRTAEASGDSFFLYDPDGDLPPERQMPFATLVTGDHYDTVSKLDGRAAYRLNIGLTKATYTSMFGDPPSHRDPDGVLATGVDQTAEDALMPHPIYGNQYWVCVVNPGPATLPAVRVLLAEAYDFAARKHANHLRRAGRPTPDGAA